MFKTTLTKLLSRKKILIALILLFAILGIGGYFAYSYDVSKIQEATMKYWEESANKRAGYVIPFAIKNNAKRQAVITKYGLKDIVTTIIFIDEKLPNGDENIEWNTFYIHRTGLFQYGLDDFGVSGSVQYKFDKAVELAKKYNISRENPDKEKIFNYPNLDPTTLQKVLSDQTKIKESEDKTAEYNKLPQSERQKICEENLAKIKSNYEIALKEAANGSTKYSETDFLISKKVIDTTDCSKM